MAGAEPSYWPSGLTPIDALPPLLLPVLRAGCRVTGSPGVTGRHWPASAPVHSLPTARAGLWDPGGPWVTLLGHPVWFSSLLVSGRETRDVRLGTRHSGLVTRSRGGWLERPGSTRSLPEHGRETGQRGRYSRGNLPGQYAAARLSLLPFPQRDNLLAPQTGPLFCPFSGQPCIASKRCAGHALSW